MKIRTLTALTVAAPALLISAPALADTPQASTVTVQSASASPIFVGTVNSQFPITLSANGTTYWAEPPLSGCGDACYTSYTSGTIGGLGAALPCDPNCTATGAPVGALLYRLGDSGNWTPLLTTTTVTSATGKQLYLAYNDNYFPDNVGSYQVTVTRSKS